MNLLERELNPPEWYAEPTDNCNTCGEAPIIVWDEGARDIMACPVCDLGKPADNDRKFSVHFYGIKDGEDYHSFENGVIADTRTEMQELADWWLENMHWEILEVQGDRDKLVKANVLEGNPAQQYWIYEQNHEIACIVEVL